jgi:hypothetical protein
MDGAGGDDLESMRVAAFLAADPAALVARLARDDAQRFRRNEPAQLRAWTVQLACLRTALHGWEEAADWRLVLEYGLVRLGRRIDAVLVTPRAIVVLEFKAGATAFAAADRRQVEDYALDLQDFHAGSRAHPIVPVLVATGAAPASPAWPLLLPGTVAPVLDAAAATLGPLLRGLWRRLPEPAFPLDAAGWAAAPYRPVPGIVDAACALYARHGVAEIASARAEARNLTATTAAILDTIAATSAAGGHCALFVTGIPGAGKTLCGLNAVFGASQADGAVFLTGNPTLVHVLREALARDQANGDRKRLRAARQKMEAAIQALPRFRDANVLAREPPHDHVIVIDEGQRVWSVAHAVRKSRDRAVRLTDSEPGHLLDIMRLHRDWAVIVCLVGGGQEIHDGEGGLAEWGAALAARPGWQVAAAPATLAAADPRQVLPRLPGLRLDGALHLDVPVRSLRNAAAGPWADAVLAGDTATARAIADRGPLPFVLVRDLGALRRHLRSAARGLRRAGLVASSGAARLRAEGLGAELPHMDAGAVARWFLDRWPDIRASDALETVATEFSCQGLELDHVGMCWGGDLVRGPSGWEARKFSGTAWQRLRQPDAVANRINTYRVLLTRARYETVIWVPRGDEADITRPPAEYDAIAASLLHCGARIAEADGEKLKEKERQAVLF